jgi:hypothetical protein
MTTIELDDAASITCVPVTGVAVTGQVERYAQPWGSTCRPCWRFPVSIACADGSVVDTHEATFTSKRTARRARRALIEHGAYGHPRELCFDSRGRVTGSRARSRSRHRASA